MIDKKNSNDENKAEGNFNQEQLTLFDKSANSSVLDKSISNNSDSNNSDSNDSDLKNSDLKNSLGSDQNNDQKNSSTSQQIKHDMKNSSDSTIDNSPLDQSSKDQEMSTKLNLDQINSQDIPVTKNNTQTINNLDQINSQIDQNDLRNSDKTEDFREISTESNSQDPILKTEVNYKKAKEKALEILERFGFDSPPVDPVVVAHELGINVRFVKFNHENKKISGFFYAKRNEIFVNEEEDIYRQVFTIAHELGHKLLHDEWLKTNDYQVLWRDASLYDADDPKEKEANCFAANLLVPKAMLKQYYQVANVEELSVLFGVSRQVITFRLKNEGFVTSRRLYE